MTFLYAYIIGWIVDYSNFTFSINRASSVTDGRSLNANDSDQSTVKLDDAAQTHIQKHRY